METEDLQAQWLNSLVQLIKFAQANEFLDKDGGFDLCLSSETEKISIQLKIEPTNIIAFPKKKEK